jgi:hypothetical protein
MANVKITELVELSANNLAENDVIPIVDVLNDTTKKVTIVSLRTFANANDYATYTSITANLNIVQNNVTSAISTAAANDFSTYTVLVGSIANTNSYITTNYATLLEVDTVQDNVIAAESNVAAVEARRSANTFYTYNTHSVTSTANIIPSTNNILSLGAPDAVYKDVYVGPGTIYIGTVRLSDTDGALTITSADDSSSIVDTQTANVTAALNVVQDNVAALSSSTSSNAAALALGIQNVEVQIYANVDIVQNNVSSNYTQITANLDIVQDNVAALSSSTSSNAAALALGIQNVDVTSQLTALEVQIYANVDIVQNNVSSNYTQITANLDIVQDNVAAGVTEAAAIETRRAANIAGAISTVTTGNLSTAKALVSDDSGKIAASSVTTVTLGYLDATSSVQSQLNTKAPLADPTFTGLVTASHDLVVSGNLTVNGETTTINSANKVIQDRFIMLANAVSGAPSGDVGIFLNRGTFGNAAIYYDESAKSFTLSETRDPDTNVTIHPTGAANLVVGAFSASTISFNGVDLNTAITDNVASLATATTALETRRTANIAGAVSTITTGNLTVDRALVSDGSGKVAASTITTTVLGYLDATSSVQTQIDSKIATTDSASNDYITYTALNSADTALETRRTANIAGAVSTITTGNLTVDRTLVSDGAGKVAASTITTTVLGYLDATSSVQTQIDSKQASLAGATLDLGVLS